MSCRFLVLLVGIALLLGSLMIGCSDSDETPEAIDPAISDKMVTATPEPTPTTSADPAGNDLAIIHTGLGDITIELFREQMPITVDNFTRLVRDGFYENILFHRVSDDFMIQAGAWDAEGNQRISPYGFIELEIHPEVRHVDAAISMARSTDPNTASAQFFICDGAQPFLDGGYAAFGVVIEGIEVVRQIAAIPHDASLEPNPGGGRPLEDVVITGIELVEE